MRNDTWIKRYARPKLNEPVAIVGSPGLRSIGKLVIGSLVTELKPQLIAELYSIHFPLIYQTKPSYASNPRLPGIAGITINSDDVDFPKIQFYAYRSPPLVFTQGYHANFAGQYEIAEKVLDFFDEIRVRRIIVAAGYGRAGETICCAATSQRLLEEMKEKYDIEVGYDGPFYGFSGMVFGLARLRKLEALSLFARTDPVLEDPEQPDEEASKHLLKKLTVILNLSSKW